MAERGGGRVREIAGTWPPRRAAEAGGLLAPPGFDVWTSLVAKLKGWARAEAGAGRLFPWVPVAFSAGIAVYFTADHEPALFAAAPLAIALCVAAILLRRQKYFPALVLTAAAAAGFATATLRTACIAHTVLSRPLYDVSLSGFVETRDIRERTDRFVLRVTDMALPRGDISLARVQLSVRKGTAPDAGDRADRNQGRVKDLLHRRPSTMRLECL